MGHPRKPETALACGELCTGGWRRLRTAPGAVGWDVAYLGRILIAAGLLAAAGGVIVLLLARAHVPLGHLPGDYVYRGRRTTVYFPWVTTIVVSAILTLALNFLFRR